MNRTFDALHRPLAEHTEDGAAVKLRRAWRYIDYDVEDPDFADHQAANLFGQVEEARDADGLRYFEYDHRGLVTKVRHRFWGCDWRNGSSDFWQDGGSWDPAIPAAARSDIPTWLALQHLSDPTTLEITTAYDPAGRPVQVDYPQGMRIRSRYNAAGLLQTIEADRGTGSGWEAVVSSCAYNARGQLIHQTFGNGTTTDREYDPAIERLVRIFTEHSGQGLRLQDLRYSYDPVGNPLAIEDALTNPTYSANQPIPNTRGFHYDARYRLVRATGRKLKSVGRKDLNPYAPAPSEQDYEPYDYRYRYDEVGNFTKNHEYSGGQLYYKDGRRDLFNGDGKEAVDADPEAGNWRYDANGNATHTPRHQELAYTHDNQARYVDMDGDTEVRYVRHGDQRVLKFVRKNGVKALGVYLGPWEYHERMGVNARAKVVLHLEGHGRHAQGEVVLDGADSESLPWFFVHGDHLGSGHILTKSDGSFVSQEEYFPYGRASDRRDARNRYRFIGVEQDEETGLCMTGPRTYDPVSGRFLQGDPIASDRGGINPFHYASGNPVGRSDPGGYSDAVQTPDLVGAAKQAVPEGDLATMGLGMVSGGLNMMADQLAGIEALSPTSEDNPAKYAASGSVRRLATGVEEFARERAESGGLSDPQGVVERSRALGYFGSFAAQFLGPAAVEAGLARLATGGRAAAGGLASKGGVAVASGGGETLPMSVVRTIKKGEKIADIVNEGKALTFTTGNEHALVTLASGERALVTGGPGGISFSEGQITRLFGHTHPTSAPPSAADFQALRQLGQTQQTVFHGGQVTKIRP